MPLLGAAACTVLVDNILNTTDVWQMSSSEHAGKDVAHKGALMQPMHHKVICQLASTYERAMLHTQRYVYLFCEEGLFCEGNYSLTWQPFCKKCFPMQ